MKIIQSKIMMLSFITFFEMCGYYTQTKAVPVHHWQRDIQQRSENIKEKSPYFPKTDSIQPKGSEFIYIYEKNLTKDDYKNAHFIYENDGIIIAAQIRSTQISRIPCHYYFHLFLYNKGIETIPLNEPLISNLKKL